MPRCVRNFWIDLHVDGRTAPIRTGPAKKDGGFQLRVRIRENGDVSEKVLSLDGMVRSDGTLEVVLHTTSGQPAAVLLRGSR